MNIFLTFDYELFFGEPTGSVDQCMIYPSDLLLEIAQKHKVSMVFFVDVGHLVALDNLQSKHSELRKDLDQIRSQLLRMLEFGHDIQLHIHPHWKGAKYENKKWILDTNSAYKLSDLPELEAQEIVVTYKNFIDQFLNIKTKAYRAGGWCIQPFEPLAETFKSLEIQIDSSVITGAQFTAGSYVYDFSTAPQKSKYSFSNDVCIEDKNGYFTEYPISSMLYSPLFFWRLYVLGRLFPKNHKMIGDGMFIPQPGKKVKSLLKSGIHHVSSDGYYAQKLKGALKNHISNKQENLVVIGHPKSMTLFSLKKLDQFIASAKRNNRFCTFKEMI